MSIKYLYYISLIFFSLLLFSNKVNGQIAFTNPLEVCENDTVVFKDNSTIVGATAVEYGWDFNGDGIYDKISTLDTTFNVYGNSLNRIFNVKLRVVTSVNDTLYSLPKSIKINYLPVLLNSGNPSFTPNACKLDTVNFFNNFYIADGSINNTYWYFNNQDETYTQSYFSRAFDSVGVYTVKITAFSNKGCKTTVSSNLTINELPLGKIVYGGPIEFYNDKSIDLTVSGFFDAINWNTNATTPTINVNSSGVYSAELVNAYGCKTTLISDSIIVKKELPINAMNLLTLNDDGKNDVWKIYDIEAYGTCEVAIFDRDGNIVFENKHYSNTWNGRNSSGEKLAEGTYFYSIKASELEGVKEGIINILH